VITVWSRETKESMEVLKEFTMSLMSAYDRMPVNTCKVTHQVFWNLLM